MSQNIAHLLMVVDGGKKEKKENCGEHMSAADYGWRTAASRRLALTLSRLHLAHSRGPERSRFYLFLSSFSFGYDSVNSLESQSLSFFVSLGLKPQFST